MVYCYSLYQKSVTHSEDVAGIQEVKLLGCGVYRVAKNVVIAAGRLVEGMEL